VNGKLDSQWAWDEGNTGHMFRFLVWVVERRKLPLRGSWKIEGLGPEWLPEVKELMDKGESMDAVVLLMIAHKWKKNCFQQGMGESA
jgi:hypothetical protein